MLNNCLRYLCKVVPDKTYSILLYRYFVGKGLALSEPQKYFHKIVWLKLHYHDPLIQVCSDKYLVRLYISSILGDKYLVPMLGVYDCVEGIDFQTLPDKFVLKTTNGSGTNYICSSKNDLDWPSVKLNFKKWLKEDFYFRSREWCYKKPAPRIICERFIGEDNSVPKDYKVYCFHGEPMYIAVFHGRFTDKPSQTIYDSDWNVQDCVFDFHFEKNLIEIEPIPNKFNEMMDVARRISKAFIHVRVDFYMTEGSLFIGELTFFNAGGNTKMIPESREFEVGELIDLSQIDQFGRYRPKS